MRYRLLGNTGLRVSDLFLGTMGFGADGGADLAEARRVLHGYAEAGGNVLDTAVNYGGGRSEEVVGKILDGQRDQFVLATKYTLSRDRHDLNAAGNHRKNLTGSLEASLRRLRTDHIDLYWVHVWDRHTPIEETMRALDDAVRAGKVGYVGISDAPAWVVSRANTLADWRDWTPFAGIQVPYSVLERDVERELLPMAEYLGLSVAAWSPLAGGVLSGKFSGAGEPGSSTRVAPDAVTERDHRAARAVIEVAGAVGATPAQVAIAWLLARSRAVHPIIGPRDTRQLADTLGATEVELSGEAVDVLTAAVDFTAGFPKDFVAQCDESEWIYGAAVSRLDGR